MAVKSTGSGYTPVAKTQGKGDAGETAFANRLEALRGKLRDAEIHFEDLGKEGYRSKQVLQKFNLSIKGAVLATKQLEKDLKDVHSKIFATGSVPASLKKTVERYAGLGNTISELVKVTNTIEKSLGRLKSTNAGSKGFSTAYQNLSSATGRGMEVLPTNQRTEIGKQVSSVFRAVLKDAASGLRGYGVASLAAGISVAGSNQPFQLGTGTAEVLNSKLLKDQLRDQRTFNQQAGAYAARGPGMYEAMYARANPFKFGKVPYSKGRLPVPAGGGFGGGGPPLFTGGGLPAAGGGGPLGPRMNADWTRGTSAPFVSRYAQGISDAEIVGGEAAAAGGGSWLPSFYAGAYLADRISGGLRGALTGPWNAIAGAARPGYTDLERIGKAGRISNMGPEGMRIGLTVPGKELTSSPFLSRLGYPSAADAADVYSAYGSPYRATHAFAASTSLAQNPLTGFQGATEWAAHLQRLQSMGIGAGEGGLDANIKAIEEGTRIGVEKGMPPEQVFHNMETFLRIMASTNTLRSPAEIAKFATLGSTNSALPGVRDLSALASQQGVYKSTLGSPLSDPLYFASLMTETKRITGSFTPGAAGIQKVLDAEGGGLKLDAKTRNAINMFRTNPAIVWGMVGHEGTDPNMTERIRWKTQFYAAKGMHKSDSEAKAYADAFVFATTPDAAKDQFLAGRGYGPTMAKPSLSMSDFDAMLGMTADRAGVAFSGAGRPLTLGRVDTGEFKKKGITIPGLSRTDFRSPTLGEPFGLKGSLLEKARMMEGGTLSVTLEKAGVDIDEFGGKMANASKSVTSFMDSIGKFMHWVDVKIGLTGGGGAPTGSGTPPAVPAGKPSAIPAHGGRGSPVAP